MNPDYFGIQMVNFQNGGSKEKHYQSGDGSGNESAPATATETEKRKWESNKGKPEVKKSTIQERVESYQTDLSYIIMQSRSARIQQICFALWYRNRLCLKGIKQPMIMGIGHRK